MATSIRILLHSPSLSNKVDGLLHLVSNLPFQLVDGNAFIDALKRMDEIDNGLKEAIDEAASFIIQFDATDPFFPEIIAGYFNALSFGFEQSLNQELQTEKQRNEHLKEKKAHFEELRRKYDRTILDCDVGIYNLEGHILGNKKAIKKNSKKMQTLQKKIDKLQR
ncbi:hypothetical protein QR680_015534 [Steinernema hermaphroditum]|uniref:Uncharacterized protein n=1 Tax=Steinernema hermaphroditum TaxID=289476 RepID=A0AA39H826_9BILA|nr:hypothetical protein QR680_015534 [Steinernema hermaphroditum]